MSKTRSRVPLGRRLARKALNEKIVTLRLAGIPTREIARQFGLKKDNVDAILRDEYDHAEVWRSLTVAQRKYEREQQLERHAAQLAQIVSMDDKARTAAGIELRTWLAVVEVSVKINAHLIALHGLNGVLPPRELGSKEGGAKADPYAKGRVVSEFIESLEETQPEAYRLLMRLFGRKAPAAPIPAEEPARDPAPGTETASGGGPRLGDESVSAGGTTPGGPASSADPGPADA